MKKALRLVLIIIIPINIAIIFPGEMYIRDSMGMISMEKSRLSLNEINEIKNLILKDRFFEKYRAEYEKYSPSIRGIVLRNNQLIKEALRLKKNLVYCVLLLDKRVDGDKIDSPAELAAFYDDLEGFLAFLDELEGHSDSEVYAFLNKVKRGLLEVSNLSLEKER